jgi:hypothetical protein
MNKLWNWYDNVKSFFMLLAIIPFILVWWAVETKHWSDKHIIRILDLYMSFKEVIKNVRYRFNKS